MAGARRRRIQRRRSSDPSELLGLVEPSRLHDWRLGEKERDDVAGVEWGFLLLDLGQNGWGRETMQAPCTSYTGCRFEVPLTCAHACRSCGHEAVSFVKHVVR